MLKLCFVTLFENCNSFNFSKYRLFYIFKIYKLATETVIIKTNHIVKLPNRTYTVHHDHKFYRLKASVVCPQKMIFNQSLPGSVLMNDRDVKKREENSNHNLFSAFLLSTRKEAFHPRVNFSFSLSFSLSLFVETSLDGTILYPQVSYERKIQKLLRSKQSSAFLPLFPVENTHENGVRESFLSIEPLLPLLHCYGILSRPQTFPPVFGCSRTPSAFALQLSKWDTG